MIKKTACMLGAVLLVVGSAAAQYTRAVYSESNDGMVEFRVGWTDPDLHWENDSAAYGTIGEWYGTDGLVSTVLPFELPNVGAVIDPFTSADFQVFSDRNELLANVDLYFVRTASSNDLLAADYFSGTDDTGAVMIAENFISPGTPLDYVNTDSAADAELLDELNAAYAGGAGAGQYVFLRLSYASDAWPTGTDSCGVATRNNSNGNYWPALTFTDSVDGDNDGLPDGWEILYGLDPTDDGSIDPDQGASGDPDFDDLTNAEEFAEGTNPQDPDTDGDDLTDGVEVNTENTDPLDVDTDGDYLRDGDEVNTYGSSPLLVDSDGDDANDATEVYSPGGNPTNSLVLPANDRPEVIGIDSFDYVGGVFSNGTAGGELFDYDNNTINDLYVGHTGSTSLWWVSFGTPSISAGALQTQEGGMYRSLNGPETGGESVALFADASVSPEVDLEVIYAKVDITRAAGSTWSGFSVFATGTEEIFFGVGEDELGSNVFKIDESGVGSINSSVVVSNGQTYTMVVKMDADQKIASLWVDPDLGSPEGVADVKKNGIFSENLRCDAIRLASGGTAPVTWDNLILGTTWASLSTSASDNDGDGLPNSWETTYGLDPNDSTGDNGAAGNPDGDGLNNTQELNEGTDPTESDTDGDDLDDDVEVNTYMTDPTDADSDDDNLKDGYEVTTGVDNDYITNPLKADTDGDLYNDDNEINNGTDPTDPDDNPGASGVIIVDGAVDPVLYGSPVAIQTVNTGFGDNYSELNAAYAYVKDRKLYLMLAGNIEANWNKLEIFFDTSDAITSNVFDSVGNDGGDNLDGLTFDTDFSPEFHCHFRRDTGNAYFDIADLVNRTSDGYGSLFAGEGSASTGTGTVNSAEMIIGYDNSNTGGVGGDQIGGAATEGHWTNSLHGFELCIDLADLGDPVGTIKVCATVNGSGRDFLSNQVLGGLPVPSANLGAPSGVDFSALAGNQYFEVSLVEEAGSFSISSISVISSGTQVQLGFSGLTLGVDYVIQDATQLSAGFNDVAGSEFTATNEMQSVVLPTSDDARFFQGSTVVPQ